MIRLFLSLLLLALASPVWAMEHFTDVLQDTKGNIIGQATVHIYLADTTTHATIYSDNGVTPKANPFSTNTFDGTYDFYASNGVYDIAFSKPGVTFNAALTKRRALFDVNDGGGGGGGGSAAFSAITNGTNTGANMIVGSGGTLTFSGAGVLNASTVHGNYPLLAADGGTGLTTATDDTVLIGNGSLYQAKTLPSCSTPSTSKLLYDSTTNLFSCGSDSAGTFATIAAGTNTSAAFILGSGSSLTFSGTGTNNASSLRGNYPAAVVDGGTGFQAAGDDQILIGTGAAFQLKTLPSCSIAGTSKLLYDTASNSFSCGTDSGGTFDALGSGTNISATMTVGTGGSLTFSGSGTVNASTFKGNATVAAADGGTGQTVVTDDGLLVANGSIFQLKILPGCNNPTVDKLLYDSTANSFICGTDQSAGGGTTFNTIGSGTNTTATMTVGSGGTITLSGTGNVTSNSFWPNVVTVNAGNSPYTALTTNATLLCDTSAAARIINLPAATNKVILTVFNVGSNTCTINRAGADTITTGLTAGLTSFILRNAGSTFWLQPDGTNLWYVGG